MKYRTIVCDPPWPYKEGFPTARGHQFVSRRRLSKVESVPYKAMSLEEIQALPVSSLAMETGANLFLWTTNKYLPAAFDVLKVWGAKYRQCAVWVKPPGSRPGFCASIAPNCAEFLLVAKFKNGGGRVVPWNCNVVVAESKVHSRKPEIFMDLIEQVSPGPYVELFARRARPGWDVWSDEAPGSIDWPESGMVGSS